jgi:hypothetical protein
MPVDDYYQNAKFHGPVSFKAKKRGFIERYWVAASALCVAGLVVLVSVGGYLHNRAYNHALALSSQVGRPGTQSHAPKVVASAPKATPKAVAPKATPVPKATPKAVAPESGTVDLTPDDSAVMRAVCVRVKQHGAKATALEVLNETVVEGLPGGDKSLKESGLITAADIPQMIAYYTAHCK